MAADLRNLTDIPGLDLTPRIDPESADALDKLFTQSGGTPDETPAGEIKPAPKPDETPKAEEKPAPKAEEKPAPKAEEKPAPKAEEKPKPAPKAEEKPAPKAEAKPEESGPKDELDEVALPPYATKKASEGFDTVKRIAREKIAAIEQERDAFRKQVEELSSKVNESGIPAEVEKELSELRAFRAKLDVEAAPEFKTYDAQIVENTESIYSRLKAAGYEAHIEQIKKLGGPAQVDWEAVSDKLPVPLRRFIESKLGENEGLLDKKNKAIESAKANAVEYLKSKESELANTKEHGHKAAEKTVAELVPKLGWFEERKAKADATDEEKAAVERHNKLVADSKDFLATSQTDDSPQMRGILAVGYVQLLKLRQDFEATVAKHTAEVTKLKGELSEANTLLDKVKKSSTQRLRENNPPADDTDKPGKVDFNQSGAEALDAAYKRTLAAAD